MTATTTVHFRRLGKRLTACGRKTTKTSAETREPSKVTCQTCTKAVAAYRRACVELSGQ